MNISKCEVTDINKNGIWIFIEGEEHFIPVKEFSLFKDAAVDKIFKVTCLPPNHLYWEELDVDIELDSIEHPENYPLIFKK
jgi:hypothetical protein